jgi:hypothetical protein
MDFHQYTFEIMLYKNVDIKGIFYDNNVAFSRIEMAFIIL